MTTTHSRRSRTTLWRWCAVLLYCALLFALSAMHGDQDSTSVVWKYDKLAHGAAYGLLGWLLLHALRGQFSGSRDWLLGIAAVVLAGLYGVSDEWHQSFVPGRSPSSMDLIADVVGAATCVFMSVFVAHRKTKRLPPKRSTLG